MSNTPSRGADSRCGVHFLLVQLFVAWSSPEKGAQEASQQQAQGTGAG